MTVPAVPSRPHPLPTPVVYRTNKQWPHLKQTDPEGWNRAVEIDHAVRREGSVANRKLYLHRSCIPMDLVALERQHALFRP